MSVTAPVSQLPMTPYGLPGVASVAAKVGQDPSVVSPKQAVTAVFKAAVFAGVNTARVPVSMVKKSIKEIIL